MPRFDLFNTDDEDDGNQINLEHNNSDEEREYDSEEEVKIWNIENKQSDDHNDFISEEEDYEGLLTRKTSVPEMVTNAPH